MVKRVVYKAMIFVWGCDFVSYLKMSGAEV
jgi:hypothetical protein